MFDETNELVKSFRAARDMLAQSNCQPLRLQLLHDRSKAAPQYSAPTGSEIAALIVGDFSEEKKSPDIIIQDRGGGLRKLATYILIIWLCNTQFFFPMARKASN